MHPATAKILGAITGTYFGSIAFAQAETGGGIESTLRTAVAQAPSLVVLVILAICFLKAMGAKDAAFVEAQKESRSDYLASLNSLMNSHQKQWEALHADQLQERREIHALIEKQHEAMRAMSSALASCPAKLHTVP